MSRAKGLCLEDYVRFFNKEEIALTVDQLKKIAHINAIKLIKKNKSSVLDALRTVDLTPPGRSTIGECLLRTSANAELSLEEVRKDISSLGWQECPIVSIVNISIEWAVKAVEEAAPISSSHSSDHNKKKGGKGGESKGSGAKRKRKSVAALHKLPWIEPVERATDSLSGCQV